MSPHMGFAAMRFEFINDAVKLRLQISLIFGAHPVISYVLWRPFSLTSRLVFFYVCGRFVQHYSRTHKFMNVRLRHVAKMPLSMAFSLWLQSQ